MKLLLSTVTLLSLFFYSEPITAQEDSEETTAREHIHFLKQGVLLVRLRTKQNAILMLEARGMEEEADLMWEEQRKKNEEIVKAFELIFDFCPVYFFYDENSGAVKEELYDDFILDYNLDTLSVDSILNYDYVYFADFGQVYFEYFNQYMLGAVVLNSEMELLPSRFPRIVRKRAGLSVIERSNSSMVEEMNENLHKFYERNVD